MRGEEHAEGGEGHACEALIAGAGESEEGECHPHEGVGDGGVEEGFLVHDFIWANWANWTNRANWSNRAVAVGVLYSVFIILPVSLRGCTSGGGGCDG